jgi:hypothetical protein
VFDWCEIVLKISMNNITWKLSWTRKKNLSDSSKQIVGSFKSIFKMSVPYFSTTFQPKVFKLWILIENYLRTNSTAWIYDPLSRSSGIDLGIEPSHIRVFSLYFMDFRKNCCVTFSTEIALDLSIFDKKLSNKWWVL